MLWGDNPILMLFWRRERRWLWLRSHFLAAGLAGLIAMGVLIWGLQFRDVGVWFGAAALFLYAMMPLSTLGPFGQVARDVKRWRRQRRLSELMITPLPGGDYIRGFLFPAIAPLALFFGMTWASLLIMAPIYSLSANARSYGDMDQVLPFVLFSPLYFLLQMLWSGTITLRLCIVFRSAWAGEALVGVILVVAPLAASLTVGLFFFMSSGGFVAWMVFLGFIKLVLTLALLAGMHDNFTQKVNVEEW